MRGVAKSNREKACYSSEKRPLVAAKIAKKKEENGEGLFTLLSSFEGIIYPGGE